MNKPVDISVFNKHAWLNFRHHGGRCCGVQHIYDFPQFPGTGSTYLRHAYAEITPESVKAHIHKRLQDQYGRRQSWDGDERGLPSPRWNCLVEANLIDSQLKSGWDKILEEVGFKKVTRFFNSNSGNFVTVLHYQPNENSRDRDLSSYGS